jgi:hypothetical protein
MMTPVNRRLAEIAFAAAIVLTVCLGAIASVWMQDPRWLERAGATVSALSAGAVLFQIVTELRIEEERTRLVTEMHRSEECDQASPLGVLEGRLIRKRVEQMQSALVKARLRVAAFVVTGAMIGELLHGYGDLIARGLLLVHSNAG